MRLDHSIDIIKVTVNGLISDCEIILFGSQARGESDLWSDYDLLIIIDRPVDRSTRLYYQALLRKQLAIKGILSDVIVQSKSDTETKRNLPGHIIQSALIEGIRL